MKNVTLQVNGHNLEVLSFLSPLAPVVKAFNVLLDQ
jgi:hypothetical protein